MLSWLRLPAMPVRVFEAILAVAIVSLVVANDVEGSPTLDCRCDSGETQPIPLAVVLRRLRLIIEFSTTVWAKLGL